MKYLVAAIVALSLADTASAEIISARSSLIFSVSSSFDSSGTRHSRITLGTKLRVPSISRWSDYEFETPVSGIAYSPQHGFTPLLMGFDVSPPTHQLGNGENNREPLSWGWIAAGTAVAIGIAFTLASDDSSSGGSTATEEAGDCVGSDGVNVDVGEGSVDPGEVDTSGCTPG